MSVLKLLLIAYGDTGWALGDNLCVFNINYSSYNDVLSLHDYNYKYIYMYRIKYFSIDLVRVVFKDQETAR